MSSRVLAGLLTCAFALSGPAVAVTGLQSDSATVQSQDEAGQPIIDPIDESATAPLPQARLIGLPVLGIHRNEIGVVDNVVLGRPDGDFVIIEIDRGLIPGKRLVGVYRRIVVEIQTETGPALLLPKYRLDDVRKLDDFEYTSDMQLAAPGR